MNLYIGNLAQEVSEEDLTLAFSEYGKVLSVKIIKDLFTQQSKGFGFVEIAGSTEGLKAIAGVNTREIKGKKVSVSEARPQKQRNSGGRSSHNRGGYSGGGRRF